MLVMFISAREADFGLIPNADTDHLLGEVASVLILIMLVMVVVSTGQAISS